MKTLKIWSARIFLLALAQIAIFLFTLLFQYTWNFTAGLFIEGLRLSFWNALGLELLILGIYSLSHATFNAIKR
jgi:hypothetical protein